MTTTSAQAVTESDYMARALFLAARGLGRTSPNPAVGAVVVTADGVVAGQGFHARAGAPHAEMVALGIAGAQARGATLYCSLEPCCHTGRTGPCVERIVAAGIARLVAAVQDPNPLVRGRGFEYLRAHGVAVTVGVAADQAVHLNRPFFTLMEEGRPFVTLKAAVSVDGCLTDVPGSPLRMSSPASVRHAHTMRARTDAIAVGVGTVIADDPQLTARGVFRERPLTRVVFDRSLRMPPQARLLATASQGPVVLVTTPQGFDNGLRRRTLESAGAQIVVADGSVRGALRALALQGIGALVLEGGAALHEAAWTEGVVDHVQVYVTPHLVGKAGLRFLGGRSLGALRLVQPRTEPLGPDVLLEGYVHRTR